MKVQLNRVIPGSAFFFRVPWSKARLDWWASGDFVV